MCRPLPRPLPQPPPPHPKRRKMPTLSLLQQIPLFNHLPEPALLALANLTRVDHFEANQLIFQQAEPCDRVWVLRTGRVKIVYQEASGREVILETISPNELFGGTVLFMPRHPANAYAMIESETVSFSSEQYQHFLTQHPPLAIRLIRMLGQRLHSLMAVQILAGEKVERRLAHILLKLAHRTGRVEPEGTLITIPLSRQDLADMSGTTLETTIRTMSRFNKEGVLETRRGGYVFILQMDTLQKIADE